MKTKNGSFNDGVASPFKIDQINEGKPHNLESLSPITPENLKVKIFIVILLIMYFQSFVIGIIPASLVKTQDDTEFNYFYFGILGSAFSIGNSIAIIFSQYILNKFSTKNLLIISIICNVIVSLLLLNQTQYLIHLLIFIGFFSSFPIIISPCWINRHSPLKYSTIWNIFLLTSSNLGFVSGYLICGYLVLNFSSLGWHYTFLFQAIGLSVMVIFLFQIKSSDLIVLNSFTRIDIDLIRQRPVIFSLICNPIFISIALSLASIYSVINGCQFFVSFYAIKILKFNQTSVNLYYCFSNMTSIILGICIGSYCIENYVY